ncbi:hypothetical protein [Lactobacillus pentosus] [Lactiplantibacillus mudanjiangensis]|uniref:hypothetical protein n=1 Tax=Lactiplantibacillus mudanjiangensis TaxID=1296538 RepID=UPI001014004B|nr:hypothetical protein [Lactobacillus pentosus] [Lactiplantibacillus mudanjiangensis]
MKIEAFDELETELTKAKRDLVSLRKNLLKQGTYISVLEERRRQLMGDLDEVDTPNYHFARENKHYDKPSNWKVSVLNQDKAIQQLSAIDNSFVKHEQIERDKVDLKVVKQWVADGQLDPEMLDSLAIAKIQPKIMVKAKVN